MLTPFFVFARIIANPFSNVLQKKLAGGASHPLFIILITHGLLSLVALPVLLLLQPALPGAAFWHNMTLCAVLAITGNTLIVAALQNTDLSILGPINAYKAILSLLLGIFMLGELPSPAGLAGVAFILAGSYFIIDQAPGHSGRTRLGQFLRNRGVYLRLAGLVCSATEAIFLKKALLASTPLMTFLFWCLLGLPVAGLATWLLLRTRLPAQVHAFTARQPLFYLLALTTGLMQFSTLFTFGALQVGYSLALFQTSALLSVLFGYGFFQEKNILRRLTGAAIMVIGAGLIVSLG
jgi:drug/metabolite transporter (DMT)-like permease